MYDVSSIFLDKIRQSSRRVRGKLLLGDVELTYEDIISMEMEYSLGNDNIPGIGGVVASRIEVKLLKDNLPLVITTQELKPYLGIETTPGTIEYVPMGVFRASPQDIKKTDNTVSIVGYDVLFSMEGVPYVTNLDFPATWDDIRADLIAKGYKFKVQTLANVVVKEKPDTIRELLSDVAELLGRNVVSNRLGEIEFRGLVPATFETDNYNDFKLLADDEVKLTRLTVEKEGEEESDLTYGDDTGFTIKIKNDSITTQNELITVYNRVFPISYIAYECELQGLPHLDVGDIIKLIDRYDVVRSIPIVYHKISYTGGMRSEIKAGAPSGAISSTGSMGSNSITQSLKDLRVNILEVNHLLADKASINELEANTARIDDLYATKANIADLQATNARVDTLEVGYAEIGNLKVSVGEIEHLIAGNITAENIQTGAITAGSGIIADGAIGDAQISSLSASKLSAGIIDAAVITVKNLNADNITVGTINGQRIAEGAIDNSKVADNANIAGSKLDINDVIVNINGATTQINSTKIQVGDRSLDVELSTQKIAIEDNATEISSQRSQISALDNAIQLKVDTQTYNTKMTSIDGAINLINTDLSKATSDISVLQGQIALKVEQTDIDKSISEIEIGGRNLLQDSEKEITKEEGSPQAEYVSVGVYDIFNPLVDKEITISFDLKSSIGGPISVYTLGRHAITKHVFETTTEYQRFSFTTTIIDKGTDDTWTNLSFYGTYGTGRIPAVHKIKIEKGNKATDWTPAPEDIDQAINTVDTKIDTKVSEINLSLDGITSRVSNTESAISTIDGEVSSIKTRVSSAEQKIMPNAIVQTVRESTAYTNDLGEKVSKDAVISAITQTAEAIKIQANRIALEGLVTANSNFKILTDGSIEAKNADIEGTIRATKGNIGLWDLDEYIYSYNNGTYTTLKPHGNVAFAAGSPLRNDTTGATLQIFHDGRVRGNQNKIPRFQLNADRMSFYDTTGTWTGDVLSQTMGGWGIPALKLTTDYGVVGLDATRSSSLYANVVTTVNSEDGLRSQVNMQAFDGSSYGTLMVGGGGIGMESSGIIKVISSRYLALLSTTYSDADILPWKSNTRHLGNINYRWYNVYLNNNPNVSSDARLKQNIQDLPDELIEELKEIKPKMFKQYDKWHFGYIAQDVERTLYKYAVKKVGFENAREYVSEFEVLHKDESYLSLIYAEIAVLKEAEMQKRIAELEAKLQTLEEQIAN